MTATRRIGSALAFVLAGFLCLAVFSPARATTLRHMDLGQLVAGAHRVVHARTVSSTVYWDATGTRIYTDTLFEVLDEAKGKGPDRLTVTLLGGRIDPAQMVVEGTPVFETGEEVVLFTAPRPDGRQDLVGFSQGVLRVSEDPATGQKWATSQVFSDVTYVDTAPGQAGPVRPVRGRAALPDLLDGIRAMADGGAAPRSGLSSKPQTIETDGPGGRKP